MSATSSVTSDRPVHAPVNSQIDHDPMHGVEVRPGPIEQFTYDDAVVRKFTFAILLWGVVAMLVGLLVALQLVLPVAAETVIGGVRPFAWMGTTFAFLYETEWLSFGRLRPLHTNAAIFAFGGNAIFAAVYYSTQRLCKARMWSDTLSNLHFWGWQAIIVAAALTLPLGFTQGKEYAELEWPIDLAIAVVWVGFFGVNFMMTLLTRRERHMYVALWFYIATIATVAVLHVFNSLAIPAGALKSYSVYAGVQDAMVQWWYGHNAVAFFLTTPFLGLMYYFLPKAAERPVYSYRLSIVHFWSLVFIYIWAGPHHLHYTALPQWASTLGMLFSLMLWMPSWGGMINGLLTLRGAWNKVAADPVLKFFVVGITFYGMATFEGPMLSIKSINALSHYTDWTIAHVHGGALGWNGFMTFGMLYWLAPRLFQSRTGGLWSKRMAESHFWIGTIGILLYIVPIYWAGITQGLMWRAFDESGALRFPDFVETVMKVMPMYWLRVIGGSMFLLGMILCAVNIMMTWTLRPSRYTEHVQSAPALGPVYRDPPTPGSRLHANTEFGHKGDVFLQGRWHRTWERLPVKFTVWVVIAVVVASALELVPMVVAPMFSTTWREKNIPRIASVQPYTPLELAGRDVYVAEGCYNCHSQMVRPIWAETKRYGDYSKPGEFAYDHPFQWGSRRIGPDLARIGGLRSYQWHVEHLEDPRMVPGSIMPAYKHLSTQKLDYNAIQRRVNAMAMMGVPYGDAVKGSNAATMAREQSESIAAEVATQGGPTGLEDTKMTALVAYLQRLGTDLHAPPPADAGAGK
ncbi:MAG: cytochrome-c oxidase, cbb3-type subunit I [Phycisphaeraceae bacterium]|nr:cytochrome-c oxidase, cbb3-type subunit I [Phycisphaeraceae bacterium]MBX3406198.1 cytochrome-c oxidase, cbb3-type subunit I [Phycisphaeraceae bacterium]